MPLAVQRAADDAAVDPIAIHADGARQAPDRPLPVELLLLAELLAERRLTVGPAHLRHEAGWHARGIASGAEAFRREASCDLRVWVAVGGEGRQPSADVAKLGTQSGVELRLGRLGLEAGGGLVRFHFGPQGELPTAFEL